MSQCTSPRPAFSLIELLVVIAIISILMGLIVAATQKVRESAARAENSDRISQITAAVGLAKAKGGMDHVWSGPFHLRTSYININPEDYPELDFLKRMFPQMDLSNNGLPMPTDAEVVLNPNQALLFLLTGGTPLNYQGFSNNPKRPFTPPTAGEIRKGPWLQVTPKMIQVASNGHAELVDPWGTPYIVFAATKGKKGKPNDYEFDMRGNRQEWPAGSFSVKPYQYGGKYLNENGFQLISAGRNRRFGRGGTDFPATTPDGDDDQANFSRSILGVGFN
jgi:prepilin-type N-terminal cleavage/methylation domain-containing protein